GAIRWSYLLRRRKRIRQLHPPMSRKTGRASDQGRELSRINPPRLNSFNAVHGRSNNAGVRVSGHVYRRKNLRKKKSRIKSRQRWRNSAEAARKLLARSTAAKNSRHTPMHKSSRCCRMKSNQKHCVYLNSFPLSTSLDSRTYMSMK